MVLWILVILTMALELGLHYYPWRMLLKGRNLPRVVAYVLGVCGLMVPFSLWLWIDGEADIIPILWLFIISGGLTVLGLYGHDRLLDLEMGDVEAAQRERLLREQARNDKKE
jgi:hypothetical protein